MKYLYPYECDKRGLSNPNELQAAIDSNRREGRRQSFGSSLFTYSPNGTPTMLSSPKLPTASVGLTLGTNGASLTPIQKVKKGEICVFWPTLITKRQMINEGDALKENLDTWRRSFLVIRKLFFWLILLFLRNKNNVLSSWFICLNHE